MEYANKKKFHFTDTQLGSSWAFQYVLILSCFQEVRLGMASMPYPPWKSAPSSPGGRSHRKWWSDAKKAVLRPWRRRSERRVKKRKTSVSPYPYMPRTQEEQFRAVRLEPMPKFSPFMNQLNFPNFSPPNMGDMQPARPAGLLSEGHGESSEGTTQPPTFDPDPGPYKPTRPSLSNVFPMYSTLQVAPKKLPEDQRRHSTGNTQNIERRPSVKSTESNERSIDRRQRRVSAARALPVLNVLPKRKNSAPTLPYQMPSSCQDSPPHINYTYPPDEFEPPAMLPSDALLRLKSIQEESSDSEIKGFDEFMMY